VKYAPGVLLAHGYREGKEILTEQIATTGAPTAVQLAPNQTTLKADGEDVTVITVSVTDAQGRPVPNAANKIHFQLAGPGKTLGVGNGDPSSHEPDVFLSTGNSAPDWQRSLFSGLAQIIVQSTKEPGEIKLTARADGLPPVTLIIPSQPAIPRPAI
jgi:beta-galactosidase